MSSAQLIKKIQKSQNSGNGFPCMAESQVAFTKEKMCWFKSSFESTLVLVLRLHQAEFVEHFSIPKTSPLHRLLNFILFFV